MHQAVTSAIAFTSIAPYDLQQQAVAILPRSPARWRRPQIETRRTCRPVIWKTAICIEVVYPGRCQHGEIPESERVDEDDERVDFLSNCPKNTGHNRRKRQKEDLVFSEGGKVRDNLLHGTRPSRHADGGRQPTPAELFAQFATTSTLRS